MATSYIVRRRRHILFLLVDAISESMSMIKNTLHLIGVQSMDDIEEVLLIELSPLVKFRRQIWCYFLSF